MVCISVGSVKHLWEKGFRIQLHHAVLLLSMGMDVYWQATKGGIDHSIAGVRHQILSSSSTAPVPDHAQSPELTIPFIVCGDAFNPSGRPGAACTALIVRPCARGFEQLFQKTAHYQLLLCYKGDIAEFLKSCHFLFLMFFVD